jgi:prepilin-type N-terminal cleavage/methylation domain-containing protein
MKTRPRQPAFTMIELMAVILILVLFLAMALPAISKMMQSNKVGQARSMIKSFFALAQARAAETQNYVGVRFQFDKNGWLNGKQYLVLIENYNGDFSAVPNTKPAALPPGVVAITGNAGNVDLDNDLGHWSFGTGGMMDSTTFSIVFSPTGQLVIKTVVVRPWQFQQPAGSGIWIFDHIFNSSSRVLLNDSHPDHCLLYCDGPSFWDYRTSSLLVSENWCRSEYSATSFRLAEVDPLVSCDSNSRFTQYVYTIESILINQYTGEVFEQKDYQ